MPLGDSTLPVTSAAPAPIEIIRQKLALAKQSPGASLRDDALWGALLADLRAAADASGADLGLIDGVLQLGAEISPVVKTAADPSVQEGDESSKANRAIGLPDLPVNNEWIDVALAALLLREQQAGYGAPRHASTTGQQRAIQPFKRAVITSDLMTQRLDKVAQICSQNLQKVNVVWDDAGAGFGYLPTEEVVRLDPFMMLLMGPQQYAYLPVSVMQMLQTAPRFPALVQTQTAELRALRAQAKNGELNPEQYAEWVQKTADYKDLIQFWETIEFNSAKNTAADLLAASDIPSPADVWQHTLFARDIEPGRDWKPVVNPEKATIQDRLEALKNIMGRGSLFASGLIENNRVGWEKFGLQPELAFTGAKNDAELALAVERLLARVNTLAQLAPNTDVLFEQGQEAWDQEITTKLDARGEIILGLWQEYALPILAARQPFVARKVESGLVRARLVQERLEMDQVRTAEGFNDTLLQAIGRNTGAPDVRPQEAFSDADLPVAGLNEIDTTAYREWWASLAETADGRVTPLKNPGKFKQGPLAGLAVTQAAYLETAAAAEGRRIQAEVTEFDDGEDDDQPALVFAGKTPPKKVAIESRSAYEQLWAQLDTVAVLDSEGADTGEFIIAPSGAQSVDPKKLYGELLDSAADKDPDDSDDLLPGYELDDDGAPSQLAILEADFRKKIAAEQQGGDVDGDLQQAAELDRLLGYERVTLENGLTVNAPVDLPATPIEAVYAREAAFMQSLKEQGLTLQEWYDQQAWRYEADAEPDRYMDNFGCPNAGAGGGLNNYADYLKGDPRDLDTLLANCDGLINVWADRIAQLMRSRLEHVSAPPQNPVEIMGEATALDPNKVRATGEAVESGRPIGLEDVEFIRTELVTPRTITAAEWLVISADGSGSMGYSRSGGHNSAIPMVVCANTLSLLNEACVRAGKIVSDELAQKMGGMGEVDVSMPLAAFGMGPIRPPALVLPGESPEVRATRLAAFFKGLHSGTEDAPTLHRAAHIMAEFEPGITEADIDNPARARADGEDKTNVTGIHRLVISDGDIFDPKAVQDGMRLYADLGKAKGIPITFTLAVVGGAAKSAAQHTMEEMQRELGSNIVLNVIKVDQPDKIVDLFLDQLEGVAAPQFRPEDAGVTRADMRQLTENLADAMQLKRAA